jgi:tRNA A-37 threonylcarbamoyl transferase component Bud32
MTATQAPDRDELRAFCAGQLSAQRFEAVDRWLASLPEAEADRLLSDVGASDAAGSLGMMERIETPQPGFATDLPRGRLRPGLRIGSGGMAVVNSAHDRVLNRVVAVKVLRQRQPDESLEQYHLREAAFRREAALTAGLQHPAIPPVYDIGTDGGMPAFAMQRLDGRSLATVVRDHALPIAERLEMLLRIAEAIGYAHNHGVVHRDLTPQNILLADYGAVYVLDWGLAATTGSCDGIRAGTPAWMAPEQSQAAAVDPRMDVFGLGAIAFFTITGLAPRPDPERSEQLDLTPLIAQRVAHGLAALIRRCLATDPAHRYADGGEVAADLQRWMSDGITMAQEANRWELAWLRLRRSPRIMTGLVVSLVAMLLIVAGWWTQDWRTRHEAELRLAQIGNGTAIDRAEAVAVALDEVRVIRSHHPGLAAAQALEARLQAAHDLAEHRDLLDRVRTRLMALLHRTRTHGPWADQVQDWRAAIRDAGLRMDSRQVDEDVRLLREHPLREQITASLPFLWRAEKERGADFHAESTAILLAKAGQTPGWQALGRLLAISPFAAHDPVFCACTDATIVLTEAEPTAVALALFAPEPRLTTAARSAMAQRPGDFWPLIASARSSLADGDDHTAEHLALIASGVEPGSLIPPLLLAYVALQRHDDDRLAAAVERGRRIDPDNIELIALHAVVLARHGRQAEAQTLIDSMDVGHLRHHLLHPVGHPMERSVQALIAAGIRIAPAGSATP